MTEGYIKLWLMRNRPGLMEEEYDHLATMLYHLWRWFKEDYPVGDFLQAFIANNLEETIVRADDINRDNLIVYIWFVHNELPWNWREIKMQQQEAARKEVKLSKSR